MKVSTSNLLIEDKPMKGIIGRKLGMTTIYDDNGTAIVVTVVEAGPCTVTEIKNLERDGYSALQLGYGFVNEKHLKKPQIGKFKKTNIEPKKYLREFRIEDISNYTLGQELKADVFEKGDYIDVSALSKGKGFSGVMKRHNYHGGPMSHGSNFRRRAGSIGSNTYPARVWKGKGMPGHMGDSKVTIQSLRVIEIRSEDNLIMISGAIPGAVNGIVKLTVAMKKKNKKITQAG